MVRSESATPTGTRLQGIEASVKPRMGNRGPVMEIKIWRTAGYRQTTRWEVVEALRALMNVRIVGAHEEDTKEG